jgi:Fe-Mn family superoxide dismutase
VDSPISKPEIIDEEYGSFDRFKKVFSQTATSTEGSGWAAFTFCRGTMRPIIMQAENHNTNANRCSGY